MMFPIRTESLTKRFRGVVAVDRLDLSLPEGAVYALIGTNGAGKTTLIKMVVNILQPSSGTVEILGVNSRKIRPKEFSSIGYVSENQEMPEWMTVPQLLAFCKPFYPTWDDSLAKDLVEQLALPADRALRKLSRGMKMKAALASSLAYRPKLIILDEPFSGLDPLVRDEFVQGLLGITAGSTVLISSHDLAEVESFASHVAYLDRGQLVFSEEMASLVGRFREIEVTLSTPAPLPQPWPETWLLPDSSPALLRFVDSRFVADETPARLSALFPDARDIAVRALPLRQIFIALAKSARALAA